MFLGVTVEIAREALELREISRRTGSGYARRWSWQAVADELERRGRGRYRPEDLADAVAGLPVEAHPAAGPGDDHAARLEAEARADWARAFPGEPWPGIEAALARIRADLLGRPASPFARPAEAGPTGLRGREHVITWCDPDASAGGR